MAGKKGGRQKSSASARMRDAELKLARDMVGAIQAMGRDGATDNMCKEWHVPLNSAQMLPRNGVSGHVYTGRNRWICLMQMMSHGWADGRFFPSGTLDSTRWKDGKSELRRGKAYKALWAGINTPPEEDREGVFPMKGSVATRIFQPRKIRFDREGLEKNETAMAQDVNELLEEGVAQENEDQPRDDVREITYYTPVPVFNINQLRGLPEARVGENAQARLDAEKSDYIAAIKLLYQASGLRLDFNMVTNPYYSGAEDRVVMPPKDSFIGAEYIATALLHEWFHATMHQSRTGRVTQLREEDKTLGRDGSYAKEELRAELFAYIAANSFGVQAKSVYNQEYLKSYLTRMDDQGADFDEKVGREIMGVFSEITPMLDLVSACLIPAFPKDEAERIFENNPWFDRSVIPTIHALMGTNGDLSVVDGANVDEDAGDDLDALRDAVGEESEDTAEASGEPARVSEDETVPDDDVTAVIPPRINTAVGICPRF